LAALLGGLAAACGSDGGDVSDTSVTTSGVAAIANPASQYCVAQGGTVRIVTGPDGAQSGRCVLPDGTDVDEWEYFRSRTTSTTSAAAPPTTASSTTVSVGSTSTPEGPQRYDVFLLAPGASCDALVARSRTSTVEGVLGEAMAALLAGPTAAERSEGLRSWFSVSTAGLLRSVRVDNGVARISFDARLRTTIPNASSSCGSAGLLAQLDATATQFPGVERAVFALDGDEAAFYEWLQLVTPGDEAALAGAGFGPVTNSPDPAEPWQGQTGAFSPLVAVRAAHHEGYDRLVFEFGGEVPGYLVRYGPPELANIAGTSIAVPGDAGLAVTFYGGGTWLVEDGYRPPRTVAPDTTNVTRLAFVDDFEAVMNWLAGVQERRPFRVTTLDSPSRIVIDIEAPSNPT
jgi:putative hemolysin